MKELSEKVSLTCYGQVTKKHMKMWLMLVEVRNASRCILDVGIHTKDKMLERLRMDKVTRSCEEKRIKW
jgi:hypothetical protein